MGRDIRGPGSTRITNVWYQPAPQRCNTGAAVTGLREQDPGRDPRDCPAQKHSRRERPRAYGYCLSDRRNSRGNLRGMESKRPSLGEPWSDVRFPLAGLRIRGRPGTGGGDAPSGRTGDAGQPEVRGRGPAADSRPEPRTPDCQAAWRSGSGSGLSTVMRTGRGTAGGRPRARPPRAAPRPGAHGEAGPPSPRCARTAPSRGRAAPSRHGREPAAHVQRDVAPERLGRELARDLVKQRLRAAVPTILEDRHQRDRSDRHDARHDQREHVGQDRHWSLPQARRRRAGA